MENKNMEEYKYESENEDLNIDNQQLDYYNQQEDVDDILNDIAKPARQRSEPGKRNKSKEYYVKGADLIAEIKKYQDSKLTNPDR